MKSDEIRYILGYFDSEWVAAFENWLQEANRRKEINEIVGWQNAIAHGDESHAANISLPSVQEKFRIACDLIDFIEYLVLQVAENSKI